MVAVALHQVDQSLTANTPAKRSSSAPPPFVVQGSAPNDLALAPK
jgi:hypothetical protein